MGELCCFRSLPTVIFILAIAVASCLAGYVIGVSVKPVDRTVTLTETTRAISVTIFDTKTVSQLIEKTVTLTRTETVTYTETMTLTSSQSSPPSTQVSTTGYEPATTVAYVERGERVSIVMPYIYINNSIQYREDVNSIPGKWIINGSYQLIESGLAIYSVGVCTVAYNNVVKVEGYKVYGIRASLPRIDGDIWISLSSISQKSVNRFISVLIDRYRYTYVYLQDKRVTNQRFIDLENVDSIDVLFAYTLGSVEVFIKRKGIDSDWILLAQTSTPQLWLYNVRIVVEACNSSIVVENVTVYDLAGTGIRDLRPVFDWSNGRYNPRSILKDSEGYMVFFATAGFYRQPLGILILRTKDMASYEPVKLVIIRGNPSYTGQGVLFKWVDGKIHGYLMNWGGTYQGETHRIVKVVFDESFAVVELNEGVRLVDAPPGGRWGHYDIAVFKFNRTWYAITSSFTAGTILWRIEDPVSMTFTYVKTIFERGRENPCIYPVVTPDGEIKLMISLATDTEFGSRHKIYVLDKDFNPVEEYDIITYRVWSAGHSFYLDPWYIYINQDQSPARRFTSGDIWPGAYIEVYKLNTNYKYYIEEE